ncbi:hypothetical protein E2C01_011272 [Portunus trituberculatus]|uniref:Uncharacterized protein n=1 Tax=Portunus trituberculatus TaxID=210409 RepID=A0A5B7DAS1_PORTR|nr:hypothetical protein [Portunus trituberculatus]
MTLHQQSDYCVVSGGCTVAAAETEQAVKGLSHRISSSILCHSFHEHEPAPVTRHTPANHSAVSGLSVLRLSNTTFLISDLKRSLKGLYVKS